MRYQSHQWVVFFQLQVRPILCRSTDRGKALDKRTFIGMVEAGEPLIQQAVDAMREYHQAQDRGASAEEIERLRLIAESLFQAVSDYQLRVVAKARGKVLPPLH